MNLLFVLLLVPSVFSFSSTFNYGCQTGKCTFQLVVPLQVAQKIDEQELSSETNTIAMDLDALNKTISTFGGSDTDAFTTNFNSNYTVVDQSAQDVSTRADAVNKNVAGLLADAQNANYTAQLLYNSIDCFKSPNSSYTCFTRPTTVAPPTTVADVTSTANPATDSTQGSDGTVTNGGSTVPFTGTTVSGATSVPVTGASDSTDSTVPGPSGSTGSAVTDPSPSPSGESTTPSSSGTASTSVASSSTTGPQ